MNEFKDNLTCIGTRWGNGRKRHPLKQIQLPKKIRTSWISYPHAEQGKYTRSKLLQLVSSLALVQDYAVIQLLLQPWKIPSKSGSIPNMALPKPFEFCSIFHRLEVGDERSCDSVSPLTKCFSDGKAGLVTDLDFLNKKKTVDQYLISWKRGKERT